MKIIETPEQELQHQIGALMWENTAMRYQIEKMQKELDELKEKGSQGD